MLPFVFSYITYKDVFNKKAPTIDEVSSYFSSLHTGHLVQALCKLNIALWKSKKDYTIHNDLLKLYFSDEELEQIRKFRLKHKNSRPFVFHRQQLLIAIKVALLSPNTEGEREIDNKKLGKYLLGISDYLDESNQPPLGANIFVRINYEFTRKQIARLIYFSRTENLFYSYTRALQMWLDIPFTERGKALLNQFNIDLHDEFLKATGLTIQEYLGFSILYTMPLLELDARTPDPNKFMIFWNYLENTKLSQEKRDVLYKLLSQNIEDYFSNNQDAIHNKLQDKDYFENNFLPLVENPVVNINKEMAIVTDPSYSIDRTTHGVYWILHNKYQSENNKVKLFALSNYYGMLHQEYTYQTLLSICDEVVEVPTREGVKTADFIAIVHDNDGDFLFVVESKKLALPLPVTFDSTKEQTINKLKQIFFDGGFRQVFSTIKEIQEGKLIDLGLNKLKGRNIKAIFPILALDSYLAEETLNRKLYEDEFFNKLEEEVPIGGKIPVAHPIFFCSDEIETLETIGKSQEQGKTLNLANILAYRNEQLNHRYNIPQRQFIHNMTIMGVNNLPENLDSFGNTLYLLKPDDTKNTRIQGIFKRHMDEIKKMLFDVPIHQN